MKTIFLSLCLLGIGLHSIYAQLSDEKRHFLSLNNGPAIPTGAYASTSSSNAGYANSGYHLNLEGAYYTRRFAGIGGAIGFFQNSLNTDAFEKDFSNSLASSGITGSYSGTVGNWSNFYVLFGPYFSLPIKKFTFDMKLLTGFVSTTQPSLDMTIVQPTDPANPVHVVMNSATGTGLGVGTGIGARYHLSKRIALKLNADILTASPKIQQTAVATYHGNTSKNTDTYSQSVTVITINAGIAFQFTK